MWHGAHHLLPLVLFLFVLGRRGLQRLHLFLFDHVKLFVLFDPGVKRAGVSLGTGRGNPARESLPLRLVLGVQLLLRLFFSLLVLLVRFMVLFVLQDRAAAQQRPSSNCESGCATPSPGHNAHHLWCVGE